MSKKVRATGLIAVLFRQTEHFEALLGHSTLLQVWIRLDLSYVVEMHVLV
jgi:hypothetical protein